MQVLPSLQVAKELCVSMKPAVASILDIMPVSVLHAHRKRVSKRFHRALEMSHIRLLEKIKL